jgi:two-component system LytT family response regulator
MIKVVIIDDEPLAREVVKKYVSQDTELELVGEASDGFEALKVIGQTNPDLLFLDIQMPKITGFEMLELLQEKPAVIFTTAYDEFAIRAFDANALDYLLKPFQESRFQVAVNKYKQNRNLALQTIQELPPILNEQNRIVVKDGSEIKIIPVQDVDYLEAYDDYVKIYQGTKYTLKKQTMNYFEKSLPNNQFIRIHRSYIVNITQLTKIESYEKNSYIAILRSGARIPISRNSYAGLKAQLGL